MKKNRAAHPTVPSQGRLLSDLNVTPMIDVLLVLLVIFMASITLMQRGLDAELPAATGPSRDVRPGTIVVEYSADRRLSINRQPIALESLQARLSDVYASRVDKTLFIMGDPALKYGDVVNVIDAAKGAGVERVGIVTAGMRAASRAP